MAEATYQEDPIIHVRIVLLGKTGNGKSATCNTLVGEEVFESVTSFNAQTKHLECVSVRYPSHLLRLVDTPGIFDTNETNDNTLLEIQEFFEVVSPGPHIFLFVLKIGRFTKEEFDTVKILEDRFGEDFYRFMICVFTHYDQARGQATDDEIYKDMMKNPSLKEVVNKCRNRYVTIDNRSSSIEQEQFKLYEAIKALLIRNGNSWYTNDAFERAAKLFEEKERSLQKRLDAAVKKQVTEVTREVSAKYKNEIKQMERKLYSAEIGHYEQRASELKRSKELLTREKDAEIRQLTYKLERQYRRNIELIREESRAILVKSRESTCNVM